MKKLSALLLFCVSHLALADALAPVIDNSNYPMGAVSQAPLSTNSAMNSTFELMARLDEAREEIQQLNGKLEEQTHLMSEMKKKQSSIYTDFDDRLQQMESKMTGASPASVAEVSTTKEPESVAELAPPSKTPAITTGSPSPYQEAFTAFRNGQVTDAIAQFNALLSNDPTNLLANNAQFWLGRAYRVNKDISSAKKAFNLVLEKYPTSSKVSDTLLELGSIEQEQHNSAQAKEYLTRVMTDFPTSKSAEIAARRLQQLNGAPN